MMRLIDADALKTKSYQSNDWSHGEHPYVVEVDDIDDAPTIDALPVVHGHWEYVDTHLLQTYHRCSECGNVTGDYIINKQTFQYDKLYYCPNCGAKMDEVSE